MEGNPSRVQRNLSSSSRRERRLRKGRNQNRCREESVAGNQIDCSGKNCHSCTAGIIADCVAVCCCPCAVLSFCALACVKAPWMMGRRCLGMGKKNRRGEENATKKCERGSNGGDCSVQDMDGISRKGRVESETTVIESENEEEESLSPRFEAEKVWLELYQLGHLDFGRVSFTGIQQVGKGN